MQQSCTEALVQRVTEPIKQFETSQQVDLCFQVKFICIPQNHIEGLRGPTQHVCPDPAKALKDEGNP